MPNSWGAQMNGVSTTANAEENKLEDSMSQLKIQADEQDGVEDSSRFYPNRPGEPDCLYYLRTGVCGYGNSCRFNHPAKLITPFRGQLPERVGQPDCQYYLKTGMCRFGATCKYHHPRDRYDAEQVPVNIVGLPMREEEKSCSYYIRTGFCKFGISCKFHHPQPAQLGPLPFVSSAYYYPVPSVTPPPGLSRSSWEADMSGSNAQSPLPYMPVVFSPSQCMVPAEQVWSTYMDAFSQASSSDTATANLMYKTHPGNPISNGSTATSTQNSPNGSEQPECQFYMKTGSCKYGSACKYNHPKERNAQPDTSSLSPMGLPSRPGQALCEYYKMYGICKYGPACKYDHPMTDYYNYGLPAFSVPDFSLITYQMSPQISHSPLNSSSKASRPSDQLVEPKKALVKLQSPEKEATRYLGTEMASQTAEDSLDSPNVHSD